MLHATLAPAAGEDAGTFGYGGEQDARALVARFPDQPLDFFAAARAACADDAVRAWVKDGGLETRKAKRFGFDHGSPPKQDVSLPAMLRAATRVAREQQNVLDANLAREYVNAWTDNLSAAEIRARRRARRRARARARGAERPRRGRRGARRAAPRGARRRGSAGARRDARRGARRRRGSVGGVLRGGAAGLDEPGIGGRSRNRNRRGARARRDGARGDRGVATVGDVGLRAVLPRAQGEPARDALRGRPPTEGVRARDREGRGELPRRSHARDRRQPVTEHDVAGAARAFREALGARRTPRATSSSSSATAAATAGTPGWR